MFQLKRMGEVFSARHALRRFFNRREPAEDAESYALLVVRRGMSPAFHFFCSIFAKERGLVVVDDRRMTTRRQRQHRTPSTDRRHYQERRAISRLDFWVVPA